MLSVCFSVICREVGSSLVPRASEMLARKLPLLASVRDRTQSGSGQEMDEAVKGYLSEGSEALLAYYIEAVGCALVSSFRNG